MWCEVLLGGVFEIFRPGGGAVIRGGMIDRWTAVLLRKTLCYFCEDLMLEVQWSQRCFDGPNNLEYGGRPEPR